MVSPRISPRAFLFGPGALLLAARQSHIYPDLRLDYKLAILPFERRGRKRFCRGSVLENAFVLAPHLGAKIVVNMEGEQHRKSRRCRFVGDARRYISKNQRIVVFRLIQ